MNARSETATNHYGMTFDFKTLCEYTGLGKKSARQIAQDACAVVRVGRRVVYNRAKIDAYMNALSGDGRRDAV